MDVTEIWNCWDLKPPPICTVKTVLYHKEIKKLRETICAASATITNLTCLNWEAAVLSRILYKYKRIFRHDKAFQTLSKIHQSLKRYLKLNLFKLLETFGSSLSEKTNPGSSHAYLPTRQMLKWLLLRLLASSRIFSRVITLAKETGAHLYKKLHLGWHINLTLFAYSMTARILVTSKFLVLKLIEWYDSLHGCLPYLEETARFVPEFSFPDSLSKWLGDVDVSSLRKNTSIDEMFEPVKGEDDDADFESDVEEVANEGVAVRVAANAVEDLGVSVKEEEEEFRTGKRKRRRAKWLEKSKKETEAGDRKWKKFRNR